MTKLDPKFIVNLKGKDFVTYEGLLDLAHQLGLKSISTELIQIPSKENDYLAIVKATARTEEKSFEGIGDCDNKSSNSMIAVHKVRMAETRAKARALRDLTNIGITAVEELGDEGPIDNSSNKQYRNETPKKRQAKPSKSQNSDKLKPISPEEVVQLRKLIELKGANEKSILGFNKVSKLEEITKGQLDGVKRFLSNK